MKRLLQIYSVVLLFLLFCGYADAQEIIILHTNDTHSQIEPQEVGKDRGLGGCERRGAVIDSVRSVNKNVLLLDAGDFSQGTPYFTLFGGDAEIEIMNAMGYDAAALGNHEFDNGVENLAKRAKDASFPLLCANYDFSGTVLDGVIKPYTILKRGGCRIGIIGVLTDISSLVSKGKMGGIRYIEPYKIVDSIAYFLKNRKRCDLVVVLSHLGCENGTKSVPSDCMLAKNTENVDIIIGGHSHTYLDDRKIVQNLKGKEVVIVTAGERGCYIGSMKIFLEKN